MALVEGMRLEADDPVAPASAPDKVENAELLFRAVRPNEIVRVSTGQIEVKPEAFRDKLNRPSVDRAHLVDFDLKRTRDFFGGEQGVISLYAYQVRDLSPLADFGIKGELIEGPQVDVEPKPLEIPPNAAHAEIFGRPHIEKDKLFRRLRLGLARCAEQHQDKMLLPA